MKHVRKYSGESKGGDKRYECLCGKVEKAAQYYNQFHKVRYGKGVHEIRDTLITLIPRLSNVDRDLVEFFAGHQIDALGYTKIVDAEKYGLMNEIQNQWMKALPYLNLWSQGNTLTTAPKQVADLKEENKTLKDQLEKVQDTQNKMMDLMFAVVTKGADPLTLEELAKLRSQR